MVTVSNKSFNSKIKLSFIIFILIFLIKAPIQAQFQPSGVVKLVEGNGIIYDKNGKIFGNVVNGKKIKQ